MTTSQVTQRMTGGRVTGGARPASRTRGGEPMEYQRTFHLQANERSLFLCWTRERLHCQRGLALERILHESAGDFRRALGALSGGEAADWREYRARMLETRLGRRFIPA